MKQIMRINQVLLGVLFLLFYCLALQKAIEYFSKCFKSICCKIEFYCYPLQIHCFSIAFLLLKPLLFIGKICGSFISASSQSGNPHLKDSRPNGIAGRAYGQVWHVFSQWLNLLNYLPHTCLTFIRQKKCVSTPRALT